MSSRAQTGGEIKFSRRSISHPRRTKIRGTNNRRAKTIFDVRTLRLNMVDGNVNSEYSNPSKDLFGLGKA